MKSGTFIKRYAREAKWIVVAQVLLCGERKLANIIERLDIIRSDTSLCKLLLINFIIIAMLDSRLQALIFVGSTSC